MSRFLIAGRLLLFAFIFYVQNAFTQIFPYRHYTTTDELSSSNVNDIIHDAKGYLWFATDRGVSRFEGFKFNNYLFKEGLPAAKISSFVQNNNQAVIAATPYKGASIFTFNFHDYFPGDDFSANDQSVDAGDFFYSLKKGDYVTVTSKKDHRNSKIILPATPHAILLNGVNEILIATNAGILKVNGADEPTPFLITGKPVYSFYKNNDLLFAGGKGMIYRIASGKITAIETGELKNEITNLICSSKGDYWFTTGADNSLYLIQSGKSLIEISSKLQIEGTPIHKIFEDHEGDIWIATKGKGLFCINHFYNTNYTKLDGLTNDFITAIAADVQGNIFIGTPSGLFAFHDHSFINVSGEKQYNVHHLKMIGDTLFVSTDQNLPYQNLKFNNTTIKFANHANKTSSYTGLPEPLSTVNDIYEDGDHNIWIAGTNGLHVISPKMVEIPDTAFLKTNITCIAPEKNGKIYFGSEIGLVIYNKGKWKLAGQLDGKLIESITSLEVDSKNRLWIGTLTGLYMWDNEKLVIFDTKNILLSDEINALSYDAKNNQIWAGTSSGLSCIDIAQYDTTIIFAPAALFKNLRTADSFYRESDLQKNLILPYRSSNFTLRFTAIYFSTPAGVRFQYKYDDAEWLPAIGRQIEFASMPYGKHVFKIKAIGDRDMQGPVATIVITVKTPYWATTWFKIVAGVIIAVLAYSVIRLRFNSIKKKQQERLELQAKIAELRHQALAASMNPHFIFNALNSIQQYINIHETDEASEYLGKFARLIRIMLNSGGKTFITLSEELERLKYYLDLEKVRFGNKLTYQITVDENIQTAQTEIPNMVIQPIVENALWHGLLTNNRDGLLNIVFSKYKNGIKVIVDDNGIGINESRKRKKSDHVSLGLQMIEERLSLLKKLNGYEATISVKDKSEINPEEHGTVVEIFLS